MLEFKDIEHFAPYIQLFAGINIAYIVANFFETIRKKFTTAYHCLDVTNKALEDALTADIASFDSMCINNISNEKEMIKTLQNKAKTLKDRWENSKKKITEDFENKYKTYDFGNVFLSVSFFCIIELIFISSCAINNNFSLFCYFFTLLYFISLIVIIIDQLLFKRKTSLIKNIIVFIVCLILAFIITSINRHFTETGTFKEIPIAVYNFVVSLTLIIPIVPIALLYLIFEWEEYKTQKKAKKEANEIFKKRAELLKTKEKIESINAFSEEVGQYQYN